MKKTYYYKSFKDDVIKSKNQNYKLKKNYKWIKHSMWYSLYSSMIYFFAYIIGFFYCNCILHVKIKNKKILNNYKKQGYFLYGNHTQNIGDVFIPTYICRTKRIYTVVSQANLGIPVIGKILPALGALPIPDSLKNIKHFKVAILERIKQNKCIVIYPEAHVWPYYTKIREFESTSFKYPAELNVPAFAMTTTYQKRKITKKPKITVYIDGPVNADKDKSKKENQEKIYKEIYEYMKYRSKESTYKYIEYIEL